MLTPMSASTTSAADDDPAAALQALSRRRQELEQEQHLLIRRARNAGMSWALIAACLGVSKQAVHKKYAGGSRWRAHRG
jgi:hypothetical protein